MHRILGSENASSLATQAQGHHATQGSSIRGMLRHVVGLLIAVHMGLLFLSSMPYSLFLERLQPIYSWYPNVTGQIQRWAMYRYPDRYLTEIELVATLPDESLYHPWGTSKQMSPRHLYVLELMFLRSDMNLLAERFMISLEKRFPKSQPQPVSMTIRRSSVPIYSYGESFELGVPSGPVEIKEIVYHW
ncbi:MAG: hypothetical protein DWH94_04510 [Planctomycetota bacterium]|nr:hypothetical protein [Pirellulales bacterium]RLS59216.1 MAG: hypothetical protein DWH94_04510 [Planctomycetota bacterium]